MDKKNTSKKKWIHQQHNNKAKIQRWEDKQEKTASHKYRKELKKMNLPSSSKNKKNTEDNRTVRKSKLESAKNAYNDWKRNKQLDRDQRIKKKSEIKKAMENYKLKKKIKYKELLKKTRKGQPVMKGRMELLLQQIQASIKKN